MELTHKERVFREFRSKYTTYVAGLTTLFVSVPLISLQNTNGKSFKECFQHKKVRFKALPYAVLFGLGVVPPLVTATTFYTLTSFMHDPEKYKMQAYASMATTIALTVFTKLKF